MTATQTTQATQAKASRKLNSRQIAEVERFYGSLDAARSEFRRLRIERDQHNTDQDRVLVEGGWVIWLANNGQFQLVSPITLTPCERLAIFN